eukprot:Skav221345  [mRNA]  locus=scaffold1845:110656:116242:- [translate_table: standard]
MCSLEDGAAACASLGFLVSLTSEGCEVREIFEVAAFLHRPHFEGIGILAVSTIFDVLTSFGLIFTDITTEYLLSSDGLDLTAGFLKVRFGNLELSMHTLYASITGGFTWVEARDAFGQISFLWGQKLGILFEGYISFCLFAVALQDPALIAVFDALEISVEDAWNLFRTLDSDTGTAICSFADHIPFESGLTAWEYSQVTSHKWQWQTTVDCEQLR